MLIILFEATLLLLIGALYRETRGTSAQNALVGWFVVVSIFMFTLWYEWEVYQPYIALILITKMLSLLTLFNTEIKRVLSALNPLPRRKVRYSLAEEEVLSDVRREVMSAAESLSKRKDGALIIIEQRADLSEFINGGVEINARVRSSLIHAIFCHNGNDFHDGAIVIRKGMIWQAKAFLTMPHSVSLSQKYGTRHLAAVGITEDTDAVVVVVSEERGTISIAYAGKLHECKDHDTLERVLKDLMI